MALLLNPNVAYLFLMLGILVAMFALISPGTNILEFTALFLLAVAGYAISQLGVNPWGLIILLVSLVPFIYAIRKPNSRFFLILGVFGLAVGSAYLFPTKGYTPAVNWLLALTSSTLLGVYVWLVVWKVIVATKKKPFQNPDYVIGKIGMTKNTISHSGSVQVDGELWSAHSEKVIPAGKRVKVINRNGLILDVVEVEVDK